MLTQERAIELFDYNSEAGTMVMRSGAKGWYEDCYLRFTLPTMDGRIKVRAHQVAWVILTGKWEPVDHRDLDRTNIKSQNLRKATDRYRASITVRGKSLNLGRFSHLQEAAFAYAQVAREHFGEFARTE